MTIFGKLAALAAIAAALLSPLDASASDYPKRTIHLVIPQPPGGPTDIGGRLFAEKLREALGQSVVVENKPGAATQIGITHVSKAQPDGYTLLYGGNSISTLPFTNKAYTVDWTRDLTPISIVVGIATGIGVTTSLNIRTLDEFVTDLRANPNKRFFGSGSSTDYTTMQLFKEAASVSFDTIRFNGGAPSIHAMLSGDIQIMYNTLGILRPLQEQGKVRIVAMWGTKRSALLPQVPAVAEYPQFRDLPFTPSWHGLVGPGKLPANVVNTLSAAATKIARDPDFVKRMAEHGMEPVGSTPDEAVKRIRDDSRSWQQIVKQMNLKPE